MDAATTGVGRTIGRISSVGQTVGRSRTGGAKRLIDRNMLFYMT